MFKDFQELIKIKEQNDILLAKSSIDPLEQKQLEQQFTFFQERVDHFMNNYHFKTVIWEGEVVASSAKIYSHKCLGAIENILWEKFKQVIPYGGICQVDIFQEGLYFRIYIIFSKDFLADSSSAEAKQQFIERYLAKLSPANAITLEVLSSLKASTRPNFIRPTGILSPIIALTGFII
ncbi:MAG: hypothetical protein R2880_04530 [Deinococcales bacterium]